MSIGDVNSNERGSGARYNDGKVRLEYIPARILLQTTQSSLEDDAQNDIGVAESVLYELANFEETGDVAALIEAMGWLDWSDTCDVFHYGAQKYSGRGDCICEGGEKAKRFRSVMIETRTRGSLKGGTQSMQSASERAQTGGARQTQSEYETSRDGASQRGGSTQLIKSNRSTEESARVTASQESSTMRSRREAALSAELVAGSTLTTATVADECEEFFAIPATSALDLSRGLAAGLSEHSAICGVHRVVNSGNWNWAKGMKWSVPLACAKRHLMAVLNGEVTDPESGLPHLGHVGCNVVMLLHFERHYAEGNDLPPSSCFGRADSCEECKLQVLDEIVKRESPDVVESATGYKRLTSADYARMRGETRA